MAYCIYAPEGLSVGSKSRPLINNRGRTMISGSDAALDPGSSSMLEGTATKAPMNKQAVKPFN